MTELTLQIKGKEYRIALEKAETNYRFTIGGKIYLADCRFLSPSVMQVIVDGKKYIFHHIWDKNKLYLSLNGCQYAIEEIERRKQGAGFKENILLAPMTGTIVKVNNNEGDIVESGTTIMIVEAMKMENELRSPYKARIKKLNGLAGDQVEGGKPLIELTPIDEKS